MELQGRETLVLINHMILKQLHKETVGPIYGWNIFQEVSFSLVYLGSFFMIVCSQAATKLPEMRTLENEYLRLIGAVK